MLQEVRGKESEKPTRMPSLELLGSLDSKLTPFVSHSSTPERKSLPSDLKYVFFGERVAFPVVISSSLTPQQEQQLI